MRKRIVLLGLVCICAALPLSAQTLSSTARTLLIDAVEAEQRFVDAHSTMAEERPEGRGSSLKMRGRNSKRLEQLSTLARRYDLTVPEFTPEAATEQTTPLAHTEMLLDQAQDLASFYDDALASLGGYQDVTTVFEHLRDSLYLNVIPHLESMQDRIVEEGWEDWDDMPFFRRGAHSGNWREGTKRRGFSFPFGRGGMMQFERYSFDREGFEDFWDDDNRQRKGLFERFREMWNNSEDDTET